MSKGDRLREARVHLELKQKDMAERLGIAQSSYNYFENNDSSAFSDKLMSLIAELGISLDWVITGKGEMLLKPSESDIDEPLMKELEERVRRIKLDASDIEDTFKKILGRKK